MNILSRMKLMYLHYTPFMQIFINRSYVDCRFSEIQNCLLTLLTRTIVLLQLLAETDKRLFVL